MSVRWPEDLPDDADPLDDPGESERPVVPPPIEDPAPPIDYVPEDDQDDPPPSDAPPTGPAELGTEIIVSVAALVVVTLILAGA